MNFPPNPKNQSKNNNFIITKNSKSNTTKSKNDIKNNKENSSKTKKSNNKKVKNNKIIKSQKKRGPILTWKKLEFPISQWTGKIKKTYNKYKFPNNLNKEDIEIILKLIAKESKNFSAVKNNSRLTFIFIFLCVTSFAFGIFYLIKKRTYLGIALILICLFLLFIYMHIIKKSINNKYKKCYQDLFYLTDYINRKYFCDLGYYLLVDYNFKFIGIYIIPNYIREILKFRDYNIEIKEKYKDDTINHLHKKEKKKDNNYYKFDNSNSNINNYFYNNNFKNIFNSNINNFTFDFNFYNNIKNNNINNKDNLNNNLSNYEGYNGNNTIFRKKIKFNNFFQNSENNNNKDIIDKDDIVVDIELNKKKINTDNRNDIKDNIEISNKILSQKDKEKFNKYNEKTYEELNSQINDRSIDKFKDYLENKYNGLGIINKSKK